MDKYMQNIHPAHIALGIMIGASGTLVAVQLYSLLQKQPRKGNPLLQQNDVHLSLYQSAAPLMQNHHSNSLTSATLTLNNDPVDNDLSQPSEQTSVHRFLSENEEAACFDNDVDHKKEAEKLLCLLYSIGETQSKQTYIIHRGISCNICGTNPLTGVRFKCINCVDYDVCSRCEPSCNHQRTHVFVKITTPIPPLVNPRSAMLPTFYPGKNNLESSLPLNEIMVLREKSSFDTAYIEVLYDQYLSLCNDDRGITKDVFQMCLGPLTSKKNLVVQQLFQFYDQDKDGIINFNDFIHGMSVLTKGSKAERMKHIFDGYDLDRDGYISRDDLIQMLQAYHQLSMEIVRDVVRSCEEEMMSTYDDSGNRPISAVFNAPIPDTGSSGNFIKNERTQSVSEENKTLIQINLFDSSTSQGLTNKKNNKNRERLSAVEAMTQDAIVELVDQIMHDADIDKDGKLSEHDFYQYAVIDTSLLAWFEAIDTVF
ncbi:uncharacterized protein LOC100212363 [Hydra vulgaris]|uniref:Uncharacterized protein LOC100212363 n=1 Tax=Hydra vulgaris TaxID=6087 RepID=A0ABM4B6U0_HYDVU